MSQTTQMESGAAPAPRACVECGGRGYVLERESACHHLGACPCESAESTCPRCEGSKVEGCDHCGEPATTRYLAQDLCSDCTPGEERLFSSCSICDRPIDVRERSVPLCDSCRGTVQAAGQYARDAQRYPDPDRGRAA